MGLKLTPRLLRIFEKLGFFFKSGAIVYPLVMAALFSSPMVFTVFTREIGYDKTTGPSGILINSFLLH